MLSKIYIIQKMVINVYTSKLSSYTITKKRSLNLAYLPLKMTSFNENNPELHLLDSKFIYHNQKMAYLIIHSILNFTPPYTTAWYASLALFKNHSKHMWKWTYLIHPKKDKDAIKHLYFTVRSWRWCCCAVLLWKNNILKKLDFLEKLSYISLMTSFHVWNLLLMWCFKLLDIYHSICQLTK